MSHRLGRAAAAHAGSTIIEVLVAVIIIVVGLLGMAGLHSRMTFAEMESIQRAQAVVLLQDMVSRINANRRQATSYVTASPEGTDNGLQNCAGLSGPAFDLCEWNNELVGAGESIAGSSVGAMIGARGCITNTVATMPRQFVVAVVWQGTSTTVAPGATTCGQGNYPDDRMRRAVTATIEIGCLQNDPATLLCISNF